jgi:hypothetical protein
LVAAIATIGRSSSIERVILLQLRQSFRTGDLKVDPSLVFQMDKDILEFLNLIFRHIKHCALLILEHSHTLNAVSDVLGKEFSQYPPHEGDGLESLLEFELDGNEVFLTS